MILGTQWKNEKESTKDRYISLAQKLKTKHFLEHPDYQYQPRKPSEKKRRMTRRKAAALAESEQAKPSSSADVASADGTSSSGRQSNTMIPDLHKTLGGKAVIELGDEDMDDQTLAAMLEKYNESIPPANTPAAVAARNNGNSVVLYDELSEAAQTDANFYSSVFDYNPFAGNAELSEEMQGMLGGGEGFGGAIPALSPEAQQIAFDEQNESFFDAELSREAEFGQWCSAFEP